MATYAEQRLLIWQGVFAPLGIDDLRIVRRFDARWPRLEILIAEIKN